MGSNRKLGCQRYFSSSSHNQNLIVFNYEFIWSFKKKHSSAAVVFCCLCMSSFLEDPLNNNLLLHHLLGVTQEQEGSDWKCWLRWVIMQQGLMVNPDRLLMSLGAGWYVPAVSQLWISKVDSPLNNSFQWELSDTHTHTLEQPVHAHKSPFPKVE